MTQLPMTFDPNAHSPSTGAAGQLPVTDKNGIVVTIVDSEMKNTNDNTGTYLALTLRVMQGEHEGTEGVHRLNLGNKSADAVRIALSELSAICHVVGWLQPLNDVSVLYNKPFRVVVALQRDKEAREKGYTQVTGVLDVNGNKPGQAGSSNSASPAPGPAPAPQGPPASQPGAPQGFPGAPQGQQPQGFPQQPQQAPQMAPQQPQQFGQPQNQGFPGAPQQGQQQAPQQQFQQQPPMAPNPAAAPWGQPPQQ